MTCLRRAGQIQESYFQVLVLVQSNVLLVKIVTLYALGDDADLSHSHYSLLISHPERSDIQVVIAAGSHLFPFRTEKLSPLAPMVLQCNAGE